MGRQCTKKILAVLIALTLVLIWGQSILDREKSSEESGFVMEMIEPVLEIFVGQGNVTEYFVRKLAHFCEFFLLGAELLLFFVLKRERKAGFLLTLTHGLFAALADETIQIFSGRGSMVQDVWLDFSGVTAGALAALAVTMLAAKIKKPSEEQDSKAQKQNSL